MIASELSPLDQIRQTEAEVDRQIASAQEDSKHKIAQAKREVQELIRKARETGHLEGKARGTEIVFKTEEEARAIIDQAKKQADAYRTQGQQQMNAAVRFAVSFVLGFEGENEPDER